MASQTYVTIVQQQQQVSSGSCNVSSVYSIAQHSLHPLLGLQAAKVLLEEQVLQEQKGRLAAEASKDALSQQLTEQQSALAAAQQLVIVNSTD